MSKDRVYDVETVIEGLNILGFTCPGCGLGHHVQVAAPDGPVWTWNGCRERPTFNPSVCVRSRFKNGRPEKVCHFYVRNGHIEFCTDSTHSAAGKTLPMEDID